MNSNDQAATKGRQTKTNVSLPTTSPPNKPPPSNSMPRETLAELVLSALAQETGCHVSELNDSMGLADLGIDLIMAVQVVEAIRDKLDVELEPSILRECITIVDLKRALESVAGYSPVTKQSSVEADVSHFAEHGTGEIDTPPVLIISSKSGRSGSAIFDIILDVIATETGTEISEM